MASPIDSPVIFPVASMETTAGLLLAHVTFLLVAAAGDMIAVSVSVSSKNTVAVFLSLTLSTLVGMTVTVQVAMYPPSAVVAVMMAVPTDTPDTVPAATVATSVLLLVHVTLLFVALEGSKVMMSLPDLPLSSTSNLVSLNVIPFTFTGLSSLEQPENPTIKNTAKNKGMICFIVLLYF
jgi:hypothetical protein